MKPLVVERKQAIVQTILDHCAKKGITAAHFTAVGAVESVELGYYDLKKKEYHWKTFTEDLEILTITGNVALLGAELVVHAHGTFGRSTFETIGGHVKDAVVSATCEVFLQPIDQKLIRTYDEDTGLNLLK